MLNAILKDRRILTQVGGPGQPAAEGVRAGVGGFLASLCGTGLVLLVAAAITSTTIAFILPERVAAVARLFLEWATALSGAGYVALGLAWHSQRSALPPRLLGVALALSYLPLGVLLLLRAIEPHWPALVAGRASGLPLWQSGVTIFRLAGDHLHAAVGIYAARLLADAAAIVAVFSGESQSILYALAILAFSAALLPKSIAGLVRSTGLPAYPPLFGPLPELPPRLRLTPQLPVLGRIALQLSLATLVIVAALEMGGLGVLRGLAASSSAAGTRQATPGISALGTAARDVLPLLAGAALLSGLRLARRHRPATDSRVALAMAACSPLWLAWPAVIRLDEGWYRWLPLAVAGLAGYMIIQERAASVTHAIAATHSLAPGETTAATAAGALGLPLAVPTGPSFFYSQALSAAATWFGAAALLAAISGTTSALPAAHALVWGLTSGVLQLVSLWWRGTDPRPCLRGTALPATLEALSDECT